jgi:hypothetical protein
LIAAQKIVLEGKRVSLCASMEALAGYLTL